MNTVSSSPAFLAFAFACVVLCLNLMFLWARSGAVRGKVKSTPNSEDAAQFGAKLAEVDPPDIARVLRAHSNAQASIYPFLALGLVYVLAGGAAMPAIIYCVAFCAARILHSAAYLQGRQPWRTVFFVAGMLVTGVLLVHVLWLLITLTRGQ
jgi:microsomal prostaglandin-E synthase 1